MALSVLTYREQLRALLPPGAALNDEGTGVLTGVLGALAAELARVDASAGTLVDESLPDTTFTLLPDWERVCALPDNCTPAGQRIAQRRQAVIARLLGNGTPSIPYLTALAAQVGYAVTIVPRAPRRYGTATLGTPYGLTAWQFVWEVYSALNTVSHRAYGTATLGTPYASWQNDVLECVMRQHAPAHTIVSFIYVGGYVAQHTVRHRVYGTATLGTPYASW